MIEFDPTLVHDWLSRSARRFPGKAALVCGEQRMETFMVQKYIEFLENLTRTPKGKIDKKQLKSVGIKGFSIKGCRVN